MVRLFFAGKARRIREGDNVFTLRCVDQASRQTVDQYVGKYSILLVISRLVYNELYTVLF